MELIKTSPTTNTDILEPDCWEELRQFTDARIALGRTGASLPTKEVLGFSLSHARAKDAIHTPFDRASVATKLRQMGLESINVSSAAPNRAIYLTRPDLGRKLSQDSREELLEKDYPPVDVALFIGDGLSSKAVHKQAVPLIGHLMSYMKDLDLKIAPVVLAEQSRVALGDEVGALLNAKLVAVLIGERPGLSSPDSLGVYITYNPMVGRLESDRNCISNIRPEGLSYEKAAFKMAWLIENAFAMGKTGIELKDRSDDESLHRIVKPKMHLL